MSSQDQNVLGNSEEPSGSDQPSWSLMSGPDLLDNVRLSRDQNIELFNVLTQGKNIKIERIISTGQTTPTGEVYDQEWDEFVLLMQGSANITMVDSQRVISLSAGDSVLIRAHEKHVVSFTSSDPACIWLAVHFAP